MNSLKLLHILDIGAHTEICTFDLILNQLSFLYCVSTFLTNHFANIQLSSQNLLTIQAFTNVQNENKFKCHLKGEAGIISFIW